MRADPHTGDVVAPYATEGYTTIRATVDPAGITVGFRCPFCNQRHSHGAAGGPGHRVSHCRLRPDPFGGSYWLEFDMPKAQATPGTTNTTNTTNTAGDLA